jgi:hypothetical protein
MQPTITLSHDGKGIDFIRDAVSRLDNAKVYVGIPEAETSRDEAGPTNAGLMYIHTNGSEIMNIPRRPVIEPAIEDDAEQLEAILAKAIEAQLDGNDAEMKALLEKAGRRGANDAKRWFTNPKNGWARNKSATIRRKLAPLKGSKKKAALAILADAGETGDVSEIDTPLINKGELRRSITYVTEVG